MQSLPRLVFNRIWIPGKTLHVAAQGLICALEARHFGIHGTDRRAFVAVRNEAVLSEHNVVCHHTG